MTKNPTNWQPEDSGTISNSNDGTVRITQAGDTRITQAGDTRVLNGSVVTEKDPIAWAEN